MSRPPLRWDRLVLLSCATWMITTVGPPAAVAQDKTDEAFKAGLAARDEKTSDRKKWDDVALQMRRAIQADATESARKVRYGFGGNVVGIFGQGGTEYLPHFFLGEALFNQQDCVGAVDAWSRSEQQGAVRSRADFLAILQKGYISCEAKGVLPPSKYDPLLTRTTQHITDVNTQAETVVRLATANRDLWQSDAKEQYDRASGEIQNARMRLENAAKSRSQSGFNDATAAADRAKSILTTLETNLSSALSARLTIQGQAKDVEQIIGFAEAYDHAIEDKKAALTQSLAAARQHGRDAMNRARDRLSAGLKASSTSVLSEAHTVAQDASLRLKQVLDELTSLERDALQQKLTQAAARAKEAFSFIEGAFAKLDQLAAERPPEMRPDIVTEREAIRRQVVSARRRFDAARKSENAASIDEATRLISQAGDRLNALISTFGPLTLTDRGVHPALVEGARLFFAGEYRQALSALNPHDGFPADAPLQVHGHLFRAAASYALFLRSREADQSLLAQALAEVEACRQIDSTFKPDPRGFTPKFITFFRDGGATAAGKAASAPSQH